MNTKNQGKSLEENIKEWLNNQGYPLEMQVAQLLQKSGFQVTLSNYYEDFETNKQREIDVTARESMSFLLPVILEVSFGIECKLSLDKPWIIFSSKSITTDNMLFESISSRLFSRFLDKRIDDYNHELRRNSIFSVSSHGHSVTQAFTTGQDTAYEAVMSAVKSCIYLKERAEKIFNFGIGRTQYFCSISFPIIVIDSKLFSCELDQNGDIEVKEIDHGIILLNRNFPGGINPFVQIYTKSSLNKLVDFATQTKNTLFKLAEENMDELELIAGQLKPNV